MVCAELEPAIKTPTKLNAAASAIVAFMTDSWVAVSTRQTSKIWDKGLDHEIALDNRHRCGGAGVAVGIDLEDLGARGSRVGANIGNVEGRQTRVVVRSARHR